VRRAHFHGRAETFVLSFDSPAQEVIWPCRDSQDQNATVRVLTMRGAP
jgi:hypothetical protein